MQCTVTNTVIQTHLNQLLGNKLCSNKRKLQGKKQNQSDEGIKHSKFNQTNKRASNQY